MNTCWLANRLVAMFAGLVLFGFGFIYGVPCRATATTVVHPAAAFAFSCPDGWYPECGGAWESDARAVCRCAPVSRHEMEKIQGRGAAFPLPDIPWVTVNVLATSNQPGGCDGWLATAPGLVLPKSEVRTIGGRTVLYTLSYESWNPPFANITEVACFEERARIVAIEWGIWSEPSPKLREYQAIWEQAVKSFRWVEGTPSAGPGRSTVSSAAD
ncbi:MAG: hypothetical protein KatS3mg077_1549 [Candidatus Binatia bacterium]|nr:MAG: hypothetical protein KatS3mg077_1539 [Candidatus Binatia bacterium]GIW44267.1 MAG: hypothetical protein KatS3mg077_1549 [Candidatus Binatia bacterium]